MTDWWGDAAQIATVTNGAVLALAAPFGVAYGRKLWKATGDLAEQTLWANQFAAKLNEGELMERYRPKLGVWIRYDKGDYATLMVSHLPNSLLPTITSIRPEITEAHDLGEHRDGAIFGPWRLKAGVDGSGTYGRTADARTNLVRGRVTQWALSRQPDDIGRDLPPWPGYVNDERMVECLIEFTVTGKVAEATYEWDYSTVIMSPNSPQPMT